MCVGGREMGEGGLIRAHSHRFGFLSAGRDASSRPAEPSSTLPILRPNKLNKSHLLTSAILSALISLFIT